MLPDGVLYGGAGLVDGSTSNAAHLPLDKNVSIFHKKQATKLIGAGNKFNLS